MIKKILFFSFLVITITVSNAQLKSPEEFLGYKNGTKYTPHWKIVPDYYTLKMDDKVYEFMKDGWNVGVIKKDNQVSGFVGAKLKDKLKDGLLFGVQNSSEGTITYLVDDVLFRSFWENGKLMFCNAVFFVGN